MDVSQRAFCSSDKQSGSFKSQQHEKRIRGEPYITGKGEQKPA